jgi:hypothetical protein
MEFQEAQADLPVPVVADQVAAVIKYKIYTYISLKLKRLS